MDIFRSQTEAERDIKGEGFKQLGSRDPNKEFRAKLAEEEQKALKEGKPFAFKPALDKFQDAIKESVKKSERKHGYVRMEEVSMPNIDLKEFSDLKNFKIVEEGEKSDEVLSRRNPGLDVRIKYTKYTFKDYGGTYTIMEDPNNAIARAQEKLEKVKKKEK